MRSFFEETAEWVRSHGSTGEGLGRRIVMKQLGAMSFPAWSAGFCGKHVAIKDFNEEKR